MQQVLLSMKDVGKRYGPVQVLQGVDFEISTGESIALIGENGAGKSTFSRIVTGVAPPDEGEVRFEGQAIRLTSPRDALSRGIAFIPQELAYVPEMSVADNILLNQWRSTLGFTSKTSTLRAAEAECRRYGLDIRDLGRRICDLKLADRQIVEIVKALSRRAKLIVLDEPTASLSEAESKALFSILGKLNKEGVAILYVSHRMDEVFDFSHKVAVLRNGRMVAVREPAHTNQQELIADMLGQASDQLAEREQVNFSRKPDTEYRLTGWTLQGNPGITDIGFGVAPGEIVGLYGLRGSGTDLIAEGLGGLRPEISGTLSIKGRSLPVFANPIAARNAGIAYVPAERKRNGLILSMPIRSNMTTMISSAMTRFGVVQAKKERAIARKAVKDFAVKCTGIEQNIGELSGGNQQKILLASRMVTKPDLLVLHEPTRGVDVGARLQIHQFLIDYAQSGCAVALITSDLEEAVGISDRLLVLRDGKLAGEIAGEQKTQAAAIALAAKQELHS
jgi:ABC-type sugar transport system ATPase subunit